MSHSPSSLPLTGGTPTTPATIPHEALCNGIRSSLSPRFQAQSVAAADASKHCFLRCCFSLAALAGRLGRKLQLGQVVGLMASEVCASRVQLAADVYEV
eukprot:COSAG03_NODE_350_length_8727_cov_145.845913_3_plen_99_part_00